MHKVVGGLLVALLLVGCAEVVPTETPTANFTGYLAGYGQLFTPMVAPLDSDWRSAVAKGLQPGATLDRVESAIYGVVTCVDPAKNCEQRGLVKPGQTLSIWIVSFADLDHCAVWATIDASSGSFINGSGPPC